MNIKKNKVLKSVYKQFKCLMTRVSPELTSKIIYRVSTGKKLDLNNPQDFNQKIMWLKLRTYYKNDLVTMCADKYAVRKFIEESGCSEILNELLYVYDGVDEIDWEKLPKKFALKCNHGCGYNIICTNKETEDRMAVFDKLSKWMKEDYYLENAEVNYQFIEKKIICEKYIETDAGILPNDYKIYCFNGEPKLALVCCDRSTKLKLAFVDLEWNVLDIGKEKVADMEEIRKPDSFEKMVEYSRRLSKGFPFVRVDFYDVDGKIIFGEMTFTPAGGIAPYYNEYGLKYLSELLEIPQ